MSIPVKFIMEDILGKKQNYRDRDEQIKKLCLSLVRRFEEEDRARRNARTKEVLALIGKGLLLVGVLFAPNLTRILPRGETDPSWAELNRYSKMYNLWSLRRTIRRLQKQKMATIDEQNGQQVIILTEKGKKKIFNVALDELKLAKQEKWDGKWRLVIYDISEGKKIRNIIRRNLEGLDFLRLQESVYLTPYPCREAVDILRLNYNLEDEIRILEVYKIEFDRAYREYFGL